MKIIGYKCNECSKFFPKKTQKCLYCPQNSKLGRKAFTPVYSKKKK